MTDELPKLIVKVSSGKSLNRKRQIQSLDGHYVYQDRNQIIEEVALEVEKMQKGFGKDTIDSLTVYIRNMKT